MFAIDVNAITVAVICTAASSKAKLAVCVQVSETCLIVCTSQWLRYSKYVIFFIDKVRLQINMKFFDGFLI